MVYVFDESHEYAYELEYALMYRCWDVMVQ